MRSLMQYHAKTPSSELRTISTEFILFTDYGEGSSYSLFGNNVACAQWLRKAWFEISQTD